MRDSYENWEEQFRKAPYLSVGGPSREQLNRIQQRVLRGTRRNFRRYALPIAALFMVCAFVFLYDQRSDTSLIPAHSANRDMDPRLLEILRMDQTGPDPRIGLLYKEYVGNDGVLVFRRMDISDKPGMIWRVDYVIRAQGGWSIEWEGEQYIPFPSKTEYEAGMKNGLIYRYLPSGGLLYGDSMNPKVTEIRIRDEEGHLQTAKFIQHAAGGHSLWYVYVPEDQHSYQVEALDRLGNLIQTVRIQTEGKLMDRASTSHDSGS